MTTNIGFMVGARVRALKQVTEHGGTEPGDPKAEFLQPDGLTNGAYIHAELGDEGEVLEVVDEDVPFVRFDRKGTSTIVDAAEVELLS